MRYATIRQRNELRLLVGREGRYLPVDRLAAMGGDYSLASFRDFGDVVRAGPDALAAISSAFESAEHSADSADDLAESDLAGQSFAPPVLAPRSIVCIGRNYLDHIKEGGSPVPPDPILFSKYANTLVGHEEPVICHRITSQLDYEGELAIVIGAHASRVPRDEAMSFVAGYTVINDISARDLQLGDVQWIRGKSLDTFAPLGPVLVTSDEVDDWRQLRIVTTVNGEVRQDATCADMIFGIPELIEFITQGITLEAGDVVATGTPAGTGIGFDPPKWLVPGDTVEVTIDGIGTLRSPIVADTRP
jgi:2-keto-4-pentenoate hydratase/2-oxohepta-3-ene-1,7-dioic acid hydratase in catechol pathway